MRRFRPQWATAMALLATGWLAMPTAGETDRTDSLYLETFEAAWQIINDSYYDPTFQGVDWEEVYASHQPVAESARDDEAVRLVIRNMLTRLRQSHFALLPAAAPQVSSGGNGVPRSPGETGLEVALLDRAVIVVGVSPGSPGAAAGVRAGDEIVSIEGRELEAWWRAYATLELPEQMHRYFVVRDIQGRLEGKSGQQVRLGIRRPEGGEVEHELTMQASEQRWSRSFANLPEQRLRWDNRRLRDGVEYLRFTVFSLGLFEEIQQVIGRAGESNAPGLILDLRGNGGGTGTMASLVAGLLVSEKLDLGTMQLRNGWMRYLAYPQTGAYLGPVAVLVDGRSASTAEILAAGLQASGRARIFGGQTAGAVLPSMIRELPNGDRLQYVVGDFHAPDGRRLEGSGVPPDEPVPLEPALLRAGGDAALEAALEWILERSGDR